MTDIAKYGVTYASDGLYPLSVMSREENLFRFIREYIDNGMSLTLQPRCAEYEGELTKWLEQNAAVVGARKISRLCYPAGAYASDDETRLYVARYGTAQGGIAVNGIRNTVKSARVLGSGKELKTRRVGAMPNNGAPGELWIECDEKCDMPFFIELELKGKLELYLGSGAPLNDNA